jgi:Putative restriction endonuclease
MAEAAIKPMSLEEFFRWDDGTETHYELIGGFPVAMAPRAEVHRALALRIGSRIDAALSQRRPCNAQLEAGVTQIRPRRHLFRGRYCRQLRSDRIRKAGHRSAVSDRRDPVAEHRAPRPPGQAARVSSDPERARDPVHSLGWYPCRTTPSLGSSVDHRNPARPRGDARIDVGPD